MSATVKVGARGAAAWRWLASAVLLGTLFTLVDTTALWRELQRIPLWVVVPAAALSVVQVVISSWRWCYTGKRLGLSMGLGDAVQEYYLATFINQVLPGGVLGDVNRAVRHGAKAGKRQKAAHAVAIERLSGQLVLALAVGLGLVLLWQANVFKPLLVDSSVTGWFPFVLLLGIAGGFLLLRRYSTGFKTYLLALHDDVRRALFSWPALPLQLVSSLLVIISYLAVFLLLAVAADYVNSAAAAAVLLALCTVLLLSMAIPLTVAGWGIREGAAALLWPLAGLPAEQGVALSVGYGALVFMGSCPGALVLLKGRRGLR
ncbi:MAG TPA: lysylphosphatidylglycerol synthase transmembrane domain-containing protein [Marinobacter sp.]|nr:lysylphosphatidylglycerol synthase transmembrane domain-containing protein [Marinobacter sp.]